MAAPTEKVRISPSVHFAQHLAANEKKIRDRAVKKVSNWLKGRSMKDTGFSLEELLKLWKGLFYCMWMSDKMIVQEDLADSLSQMVHCLQTPEQGLMFFEAFLEIMKRDLDGIDNLRLDKFLMLVRRTFCQTLVLLKNQEWAESLVKSFLHKLRRYPLNPDQDSCPDSMRFYVIEIYIEELSRVGGGELSEDQVLTFLEPLIELASLTKVKSVNNAIMVQIFEEIVRQARVEADQEDHLEFIEEDHKRLKADGVKVFEELTMLEFDIEGICKLLFTHASKADTLSRNRKRIYKTIQLYQNLLKGIHPSQLIVPEKKEIKDTFLYLEKPWLKKREEKEKLRMKAKRENRRKRKQKKKMEGVEGREPQGGADEDSKEGMEEGLTGEADVGVGIDGEVSKVGKDDLEKEDKVRGDEWDKTQRDGTESKLLKVNDDDDDHDDGGVKLEERMAADEQVRSLPPKEKRQLRRSMRKSGVERRGKGPELEADASQEGSDNTERVQSLQMGTKETKHQHGDTEDATASQDSVDEKVPRRKSTGRRKRVKDDDLKLKQEEFKENVSEERMEIPEDVGKERKVEEKPKILEDGGDKKSEVSEAKEKRHGRKRRSMVEKSDASTIRKKTRKQSLGNKQADETNRSSQSDAFSDAYSPPVTRKRVQISLAKNQESSTVDYQRRVSASPGIPFDTMKKPQQPAIKPSPSPPKRVTRRSLRRRSEKLL